MNNQDLLDLFSQTRPKYVAEAELGRVAVRSPRKKTLVLIAAIVAVLLLVGCGAVMYLRFQDMKIGEMTQTGYIDPYGHTQETEITREVMGLYGGADSPIQKAAREWYEFTQQYDPEYKLVVNHPDLPDNYSQIYGCYTQEMADKLDEIAEKYHLNLMSDFFVAQRGQMEMAMEAAGIQSVFRPDAQVDCAPFPAVFFLPGNARCEFEFTQNGEDALWKTPVSALEYLHQKDCMPNSVQSYLIPGEYEQWNYTAADGTKLLLALTLRGSGFIVADMSDAVISIHLTISENHLQVENNTAPTKEALEQMAELFDYSIRPSFSDPEGIKDKVRAAEEAEYAASFQYETYGEFEDFVKQNAVWYRDFYYSAYDLNGDGQEELLTSRDGERISSTVTSLDGELVEIPIFDIHLLQNGGYEEGSVWESDFGHEEYHSYFPAAGAGKVMEFGFGEATGEPRITSDRETFHEIVECIDGKWSQLVQSKGEWVSISEQEAQAVMDKYAYIDLIWKPIREYPLGDGKTVEDLLKEKDGKLSETELKAWYAEKMKEYDRGTHYDTYRLMDLNQDGVTDLLISGNSNLSYDPDSSSVYWLVYTRRYGELDGLDAGYFYLCENGVLEEIARHNIDFNGQLIEHTFVRLHGEDKETLAKIYYNQPADTWSYDRAGEQPLSKAEAEAIMAKYPRIDQGMQPIEGLMG